MNTNEPDAKKRQIHLDTVECYSLSQSAVGAQPLRAPQETRNSLNYKDPNRGLYPRENRTKWKGTVDKPVDYMSTDFVSVSSLLNHLGPNIKEDVYGVKEVESQAPVSSPRSKKGKCILKFPQTNKLTNYFSVSQTSNKTERRNDTQHSDYTLSQTPPKKVASHISSTINSPRSPTFLYSPLKKKEGSSIVYISDDSCSPKSAKSSPSSSSDNAFVKRLFDAQNDVDLKNPGRAPKRHKPLWSGPKDNTTKLSDAKVDTRIAVTKIDKSSEDVRKHDKYGLLGTGRVPPKIIKSDSTDYFSSLPLELKQEIFCRLPYMDLCLSANRVCQEWNEIIVDENFVPWKKSYHKLKKGDISSKQGVETLMMASGMSIYPLYLPGLIRYMKDFKPVTARNINKLLQHHPKYSWVESLFSENFEDCIKNKVPNPWSAITALVILSDSVKDIQQIIQCLLHSTSNCTTIEVHECLYCIATFLLAFKSLKQRAVSVWNGMHYRLYYALYLHENKSVVTAGQLDDALSSNFGQQSIMSYSDGSSSIQLTHEQMRIINHKGGPNDVVKIVAFAGTGKTTTLIKYTQMRPSMKFLFVVYNRSVCDVAKKKFPVNVDCKTGHGLAYKPCGLRYKHKFGFNLKVHQVVQHLPPRKGESLYVRAKFVLDTLHSFMASSDEFVTTAHAPDCTKDDHGMIRAIDFTTKELYVKDAEYIWNRMIDLKDKAIPMVHDGYLKLYQLRHPKITGYDCILIDEAQDLTPTLANILLTQTQPKILVGDPHQQIYGFRGAINAMQQIESTHVYYLTQSMRFGPEISFVAASCLEHYKHEKTKTLVGNGSQGSIDGEVVGQLAILTRCNYTLFNEAVRECCYSNTGKRIAFVGGTDGFGFPMIRDIYALMLSPEDRLKENMEIQNRFIKGFESFPSLEKYAIKTSDNELLGKIKIVKTFNHSLPRLLNKILEKTSTVVKLADIVLSTAHKAKGLEFDTVRLTDDFDVQRGVIMVFEHLFGLDADDESEPDVQQSFQTEECNLLYVAVTRAKKSLILNQTLVELLRSVGELFEYPVLTEKLKQSGTEFKCLTTDAKFEPQSLTLVKKKVKVDLNNLLEHGVYSPKSIEKCLPVTAWRHILSKV